MQKVTNFALSLENKPEIAILEFVFQYAILVHIWIGNLPKYGSAITKSFLGFILTIVFGASILSKNF